MKCGALSQLLLWGSGEKHPTLRPPSPWPRKHRCHLHSEQKVRTGREEDHVGTAGEGEILAGQREGLRRQSGHLRNPAQDATVAFTLVLG